MTREKENKELARLLWDLDEQNVEGHYKVAEKVYKEGYRKVPQGYAVLPLHNPENKTTWTRVPDELWWALYNTNQAIEDARKETAKEILQELARTTVLIKPNKDERFTLHCTTKGELKLMAERYGVKIEL